MSTEISTYPPIVIVEDSSKLTGIYEKFFQMAGLKVLASFWNAKDMLEFFSGPVQDPISKKERDNSIVLMEHRMRDMDGEEATRLLRKSNPTPKVILVASEPLSELRIEEKLFDALILKPFSIEELLGTIDEILPALLSSLKGSQFLDDPLNVERLFTEIYRGAKDKICICGDSNFVTRGIGLRRLNPFYVRAKSRGITVQLITEITRENLYYCKELIRQVGVQIRHVDGLRQNFTLVERTHYIGTVIINPESNTITQVFYSSVDELVSSKQYLFDTLWSKAIPAEIKVHELEARHTQSNEVKLISDPLQGNRERIRVVKNAKNSIEICSTLTPDTEGSFPGLREAWIEATKKGIRSRQITDITKENMTQCKKLIDFGMDLRHLSGLQGGFVINEKELLVRATLEGTEGGPQYVYSNFPLIIEQHRLIFSSLWNAATLASVRMMELEQAKRENAPISSETRTEEHTF